MYWTTCVEPSLFYILLGDPDKYIRSDCLEEFLHADDLALVNDLIEVLKGNLQA